MIGEGKKYVLPDSTRQALGSIEWTKSPTGLPVNKQVNVGKMFDTLTQRGVRVPGFNQETVTSFQIQNDCEPGCFSFLAGVRLPEGEREIPGTRWETSPSCDSEVSFRVWGRRFVVNNVSEVYARFPTLERLRASLTEHRELLPRVMLAAVDNIEDRG
jgi:hypothetical protein